MKKILTFLMMALLAMNIQAQTTKTMTWDGVERQYLEYVPSSYNSSTPAPVLFVLHGLGDDMGNMFAASGFKSVANQHGWIVVAPQALEASLSLFGQSFDIGTAWNSGVSANVLANNIIINDGVDDSGLMMAILDELVAHYNVDETRVFVTGFSMGGFMANRLAIEHGERITAIASVSGTVGNEVKANTPTGHVSALHIHGTADGTVGYENANFGIASLTFSVGLGAEATVDYWREFNHCSATPTVTNFPDIVNDSLTFEKYVYEGGDDGTKTAFIKVNGGDHTWYYTPANDIDYTTEIYDFFASCSAPAGIAESKLDLSIYPNPVSDRLQVEATSLISEIEVIDLEGRVVAKLNAGQENSVTVDFSTFASGTYIVRVRTAAGVERRTVVKA